MADLSTPPPLGSASLALAITVMLERPKVLNHHQASTISETHLDQSHIIKIKHSFSEWAVKI